MIKNLLETTTMKITFVLNILMRLVLRENILQRENIFIGKETITMLIVKAHITSLNRDDSQNKIVYEKKKEKMKKHGAMVAYSRIFLNFTWQVLSEQFRKNIPENTIKRKFWLLNYFK